jgi:hypothetical protein
MCKSLHTKFQQNSFAAGNLFRDLRKSNRPMDKGQGEVWREGQNTDLDTVKLLYSIY